MEASHLGANRDKRQSNDLLFLLTEQKRRTRFEIHENGPHLGRELVLQTPSGRSLDGEEQHDNFRRIQRHSVGISECLRGREQRNIPLRSACRG